MEKALSGQLSRSGSGSETARTTRHSVPVFIRFCLKYNDVTACPTNRKADRYTDRQVVGQTDRHTVKAERQTEAVTERSNRNRPKNKEIG